MNVIIFFHKNGCPYSEKQLKMFRDNGMRVGSKRVLIKDITGDGQADAEILEITGTPTFYCPKMRKKIMGLRQIADLEKEFDGNNSTNNNSGNNSGREVVICGRNSCPFCMKMYAFLDKNNINYRTVESNSTEGQDLMSKTGATGVPLCLILMNGQILKHKVGYHEDLSFFA